MIHAVTSRIARFARMVALVLLALAPFMAVPAAADPADIDAAARGVVRVIVVGRDGEQIFPISHGSGWAVDGETIVTNAHVVGEAVNDSRLSIGIVPSDGGEAVYARLVSISPRNDLALLTTTSPLRLPPLTIAGNPPENGGIVTAIGYPMNVDQAQGLNQEDIFRAQPPVTSQGFLSGRRPSVEFDTLLHTAPIARGNSGGPLVDTCGRVVGVNSFGAESAGTEAEFFFAVSVREMLPFLRANNVSPRINSMPCRSLADLEKEEREREQRVQMSAQQQAEADEKAQAQQREDMRREIEFAILDERSNGMALSLLLLVIAMGGGVFAYDAHRRGDLRARSIGGSVALAACVGAAVCWLSRPAFEQVEERLEDRLREEMAAQDVGVIEAPSSNGHLSCSLNPARSRVLGAPVENLAIEWTDDGCINARTQYGLIDGEWTRVLVPGTEEAVSVNRFDPASGEYVVERYLLDRERMTSARTARAEFQAPACGVTRDVAVQFGSQQAAILSMLPQSPNERLVYSCESISGSEAPAGE
ncbi:hypothetical protein GCM10009127_24090 [Alteraurantiacibacter aestuarii]|uniref:S1 family peptidase n=1 Tax=Alteraurantiacibacter aestuarii TaxID=650004 RepID=UPI0031E11ECD